MGVKIDEEEEITCINYSHFRINALVEPHVSTVSCAATRDAFEAPICVVDGINRDRMISVMA